MELLFIWTVVIAFLQFITPIVIPPDEYSVQVYLDMAERQKTFVVDAFQIGYAGVNPSVIRDPINREKMVAVWRKGRERNSKVAYMWLNKDWNPLKDYATVEELEPNRTRGRRLEMTGEDTRIFNLNGALHVAYNVHHGRYKTFHYARLHYHQRPSSLPRTNEGNALWSTVTNGEDICYVQSDHQYNLVYAEDLNTATHRHQKNWATFEYCPLCTFVQGSVAQELSGHHRAQLLFSYSLQPHIVVQPRALAEPPFAPAADVAHPQHRWQTVPNTVAEKVFATQIVEADEWQWGEMRGGSPALLVGDSYLAFFHSSGRITHKSVITYVMGAYLFQREPPFAITHVSPEPIIHPSMVNETLGWAYKVVDYIVFPMGFTIDDGFIYVSYGKNDKTPWCLKLDRGGLLASLKPVRTKVLGASRYNPVTGEIALHSYQEVSTQ